MKKNKKKLDITDLHSYQNRCYKAIVENPFYALLLEMGLGKTVSTLTAINTLLFDTLEINTVLVVAPKRVVESVWMQEIRKWEHLKHLTCTRVIGTPKQRKLALQKKVNIYLISRDNIAWLCGLSGGSKLPFDMLVVDESSSFKNHKSKRFKSLKFTLGSFTRRVILTGTPTPKSLMDLWAQMFIVDMGQRLGKFMVNYKDEYFRTKTDGITVFGHDLIKGKEAEIMAKVQDVCVSMKAEDYLDLPGSLVNDINIELGDKLLEKYKEFEKEKVLLMLEELEAAGLEIGDISAVNAAALITKLQQFANGAIYDKDKVYHKIHELKINAAKDIIEEASGKPVLIMYAYQSDKDRLLDALKAYRPVKLKTNKHVSDWNKGKIQVLIMHPASGGHGLNMQDGGNIIIWFGLTWSLELYLQANARLDRQGQKNITFINRLIAQGTIDERICKNLSRKTKSQNFVMAAVKATISEYVESK